MKSSIGVIPGLFKGISIKTKHPAQCLHAISMMKSVDSTPGVSYVLHRDRRPAYNADL